MNSRRATRFYSLFATLVAVSAVTLAATNVFATEGETQKDSVDTSSQANTAQPIADPAALPVAPFAFETSFAQGQQNFYSLFSANDAVSYGYNNPPNIPSNPNPPLGARNVLPDNMILSWTGGDPDPGDTVTYDVYLDTNPNPNRLECLDTAVTQCAVTTLTLTPGTTYYWYVAAEDSHGFLTNSPIFSFTVCTDVCFTPTPTNQPTSTPTGIETPTPTVPPLPGAAVLNPMAAYTRGNSLNLVWDQVANATEYYAEASTNNSFNPGTIFQNSGWIATRSFRFTNIPEAQPIYFRVKARNTAGEGPYSNVESTIFDNTRPKIYAAGFLDSYVTFTSGGGINILVYAQDAVGVSNVELYYGNSPTGFRLNSTPDQGVFTGYLPIGPGDISPQRLTFEFIARDTVDNESFLWPNLIIEGAPVSSAPPAPSSTATRQLQQLPVSLLSALPQGAKDQLNGNAALMNNWLASYNQAVKGNGTGRAINPKGQPVILAGGYWDTALNVTNGGRIKLVVAIVDAVEKVELYFQGSPTGVFLTDNGQNGDDAAGDNLFTFATPVGSLDPAAAGSYLLEVVATDNKGQVSATFPYVTIER